MDSDTRQSDETMVPHGHRERRPMYSQRMRETQVEAPRPRIKMWMANALVYSAFSFDLFEMLLTYLGIGIFINFVSTPTIAFLFWLWFKLLNVSYTVDLKKFGVAMASTILEAVPGADAHPLLSFGWTLGVVAIVVITMIEDRKLKTAGIIIGTATRLIRSMPKAKSIGARARINEIKRAT